MRRLTRENSSEDKEKRDTPPGVILFQKGKAMLCPGAMRKDQRPFGVTSISDEEYRGIVARAGKF
jgi:hypothetical protein